MYDTVWIISASCGRDWLEGYIGNGHILPVSEVFLTIFKWQNCALFWSVCVIKMFYFLFPSSHQKNMKKFQLFWAANRAPLTSRHSRNLFINPVPEDQNLMPF